ncbi:hypothetical protein [Pseudomonas gingeri]
MRISLENTAKPCRSRLAGDEARKPCIDLATAIAGKPAPTRIVLGRKKRIGREG